MKVIYPNNVTLVTASERNVNFPASFLENDHPKKYWKAASGAATITLTVAGGSNALALFNTYIDAIKVTVKNEAETTTLWGPTVYPTIYSGISWDGISWDGMSWDSENSTPTEADLERRSSFWVDYDYQAGTHKVIIDCHLSSGIIYAGLTRAGLARSFPDFQLNLSEGQKDYSIVEELSNGAVYIRKRDILDTYNGTVWLGSGAEFYTFMQNIIKQTGPQPLAWRLSENLDHHMYTVFARLETPPQSSFSAISKKFVNFSLVEVV